MTLRFGNGGMITNDSADRQIDERRGKLLLDDGAILAGTTQTYLNIQENLEVPAGCHDQHRLRPARSMACRSSARSSSPARPATVGRGRDL